MIRHEAKTNLTYFCPLMIGTLINVGTVVLGSGIGMLIKKSLPQRIVKTVFNALGIFTLFLGIKMSLDLKGEHIIIVVLSLVLGAIIGEGSQRR